MPEPSNIQHPGLRIRHEIIPANMSVTHAAKLIGVGRPALSNLLNGKASLSVEMAARIAKAFGVSRDALMEIQTIYDVAKAKEITAPSEIKSYVPPFLGIKATQIEEWAKTSISARNRLAVFLRTLIHSTCNGLTKVDFPGNDDAERPGWDGFTDASEATPWTPIGHSGWEFGVNEQVDKKANDDFNKRVKAIAPQDRGQITYIFVTPRRWSKKKHWVEAAKANGLWKDVRAYDASDIEQWLEQSPPAQVWFANEIGIPAQDVRSLDKCWDDWASVTEPRLTGALFDSAVEGARSSLTSRLSKPAGRPTLIVADSTDEALAFLAQLFSKRGGTELASYRDRILVFDKPGVLPRLAQGAQKFLPVAHSREVERELGSYATVMHSILVYPRNASSIIPDFMLEPASAKAFDEALNGMGRSHDEILRLTHETGRSLTVLRRRLATVPAVRVPKWAANHELAVSLAPFLFAGAWRTESEADLTGLELVSREGHRAELESQFQRLLQLDEAPVWSIGANCGVISKIDLLYAIAGVITTTDLKRYFDFAHIVLGEDDPALDLAENQRWAAAIHGKTREFSGVFREGISETLVLLAVHGSALFELRLGFDTVLEAARLVRELLPSPLTARKLEANDRDLPTYAEAAPDAFLSIIEDDLKHDAPAVLGLLRPADSSVFQHPSRTGLLWALEGLAWNPETLPRVVYTLARLAQVEISDNWVNKPINSLGSIFRCWMPQTAADLPTRVGVLKQLAERFPGIAWKVCIEQYGYDSAVGHYTHKPRWRADGFGFGEPISTSGPIHDFQREMVELTLAWKDHTLATLSDLVTRLTSLDEAYQTRVWALIDDWARNRATDAEKAAMREKIRVSTLSHRAALQLRNVPTASELIDRAREAYAALEPTDLLSKHAWLFRDNWIELSADEADNGVTIDFEKRDRRLQKLRLAALREIRALHGGSGVLRLAQGGNASSQIGFLATRELLDEDELKDLIRLALDAAATVGEGNHSAKNVLSGILSAIFLDGKHIAALGQTIVGMPGIEIARLLMLAPFRKSVWTLVDALDAEGRSKYWSEVSADILPSEAESNEAVSKLLEAGRPRAAFHCIRFGAGRVEPRTLFRVLSEIAANGNEPPNEVALDGYWVVESFKHLNKSPLLTPEEKAGLELAYIEALAPPGGIRAKDAGIPNLERYVEGHPDLFVLAVVWTFKRKDDGEDPEGFRVPLERKKSAGNKGYSLLHALHRIPGHDEHGELRTDRLLAWIQAVRRACTELSRSDVADSSIGTLLSHAPLGKDGVWPCESVRQVMEKIQSEPIIAGARTGRFNSRGAHWRGEGGIDERQLAEEYRNWSRALQVSHPYVASKLLMGLANTYEHMADREDAEAGARRRLR